MRAGRADAGMSPIPNPTSCIRFSCTRLLSFDAEPYLKAVPAQEPSEAERILGAVRQGELACPPLITLGRACRGVLQSRGGRQFPRVAVPGWVCSHLGPGCHETTCRVFSNTRSVLRQLWGAQEGLLGP